LEGEERVVRTAEWGGVCFDQEAEGVLMRITVGNVSRCICKENIFLLIS
jgi:hypothetical protein